MKISTAISVLQKDADFLGMAFFDFIAFVKQNPLAQTQKTIEAYAEVVHAGKHLFRTEISVYSDNKLIAKTNATFMIKDTGSD